MTQFDRAFGGYGLLTLAAAATTATAVLLWSRHRDHGWKSATIRAALLGSLVCVLGVTLQPSGGPAGIEPIAFSNLHSPSGADQLIANLALTMPSGFLFALLVRRIGQALVAGVALCTSIEAAQLVLPLGRVAATEDLLLTAAGFATGALLVAVARRTRAPASELSEADAG